MKCTLLFNSLFIAALSSIALAAKNDCDKINSYLDSKGVHYDEDNGNDNYSALINSCEVNGKGQVTKLDTYTYCLSENDVNKIIGYSTIEELVLSSNTGYHSIGIEGLRSCGESKFFPSGISKLTNLKSLDLFGINTYKKGDIASLPKSITKLSLSHSNVPQFVINEIGQLSNIEDLTILDTTEPDISKLDLSPLANIKKLTVSHNDYYGAYKKDYLDALMLNKLNNLTSLTLEYYVINKNGFENLIKYHPNLKELVFDDCAFDENVNLDSIKKLTKLTTLEFNRVYGYCDEDYTVFGESCPKSTIPKSVYSLTNLKKLTVSEHNNPNVNLIGNLKNLEYVDLSYTELNEIPSGVFSLNNLKYLNVRGNNLKEIPNEISNLKKLETLNIIFNDDITSVPYSVCNLKNFEYDTDNSKIVKICSSKPSTTTKAKTTTKTKITTKAKTTTKPSTTTKTKSKTTTTKVPISTVVGKCGSEYGACKEGYCCSKWGYCGQSTDYCGAGCQSGFGKCN